MCPAQFLQSEKKDQGSYTLYPCTQHWVQVIVYERQKYLLAITDDKDDMIVNTHWTPRSDQVKNTIIAFSRISVLG